jgi:hypothetical protein
LVGLIVQIRHFAHRPQLLQYLAELWGTVRIGCPAKSHNPPIKLRMGEYVSAAPERLVIRVGNDNCGAPSWAANHFIVIGRGHCPPRKTPEG